MSKKFLLILFLLWNTLLADSLVLNNVLPQNNSTIKEELYPVGLNNTYFSYITKTYEDGVGSYFWTFKIQNISTNKIEKFISMEQVNKVQNSLPKEFIQKIENIEKQYKISRKENLKLRSFPLCKENSVIKSSIKDFKHITKGNVTTKIKNVVLIEDDKLSKEIAQVKEINFFGHLKYYNYNLAGYIYDKDYNNLIVVVTFNKKADEESDEIFSFKVFGTNLSFRDKVKE
ncbi:hypothetical protein [Sulfurimonas sp.]|uniref:hypothetical protein n=1 Tax=Sulfurimonas sp. TaxID=2022749 RepID=UPI003D0E4562